MLIRQLDASVGASGPHDFTVRVSAVRQRTPPRPLHPAPNVRDDRDTPLLWGRDGGIMKLFLPNGETKYFSRKDWTAKPQTSPSGKSAGHGCGGAAHALKLLPLSGCIADIGSIRSGFIPIPPQKIGRRQMTSRVRVDKYPLR